jgi:HAD domain in Swiss Army Knife RNA repair proteins
VPYGPIEWSAHACAAVNLNVELLTESSPHPNSMYVFLDFDGVLRRKQSPLYRLEGDCLRSFEDAVRSLPNVQIVIASSWREAFSLREMRDLFSPDIAGRIVGVTPIEWHRENHHRYREVLAFLKHNGHSRTPWIAIDDEACHYPLGLENLVLVDGSRGFDADAAERMLIKATNPVEKNR